MGPSDVVYVEKRRGPRTNPWGTPVTSWCALDTSPPQATLKDLPVRFKPAKWNPSDAQRWEGGQEDLMIDSVKSSRKIQQNEDWWWFNKFIQFLISNGKEWVELFLRGSIVYYLMRYSGWQLHGYNFISNSFDLGSKVVHKVITTVLLGKVCTCWCYIFC